MIELTLLPQHLQSEPGGLIRSTVTLRNTSSMSTEYLLEIHGLEANWYTLSLTSLTSASDNDATAILTLHPPLEAPQGVHPFELLATCPDDPEASARVEAVLLVEDAVHATAIGPVAVSTGHTLLAGLPRRWVVVAAAAVALLLCAGVAYALKAQGTHHVVTLPRPCGSATPTASCTSTPTRTIPTATVSDTAEITTVIASPTSQNLAALVGTPHPGTGVLPSSANLNPATGSLPGVSTPRRPTPSKVHPAYVHPGDTGSPRHANQVTRAATARATGSATETPTVTVTPPPTATDTNTVTSTPSPISTATPSATATPLPSATAQDTPTSKPTFTPQPTATVPPTNTPIPSSTASSTNSPTPLASPTPAEISVRFGYDLTGDRFILKWQTDNAEAFTVDGQAEPLSGQQAFDLRTHTFVLSATSLDRTQSKIAVVAVVVVNSCEVRVNSQPAIVPIATCQGSTPTETGTPGPSSTLPPTHTAAPSSTTVPSNTAIPTATIFYFPTDTAIPTATNTPIPTATTVPSATPIPSSTFTPIPTATPPPSSTPQPTFTPTASFTQTLTVTPTPTKTPLNNPTATPTGPAPR